MYTAETVWDAYPMVGPTSYKVLALYIETLAQCPASSVYRARRPLYLFEKSYHLLRFNAIPPFFPKFLTVGVHIG